MEKQISSSAGMDIYWNSKRFAISPSLLGANLLVGWKACKNTPPTSACRRREDDFAQRTGGGHGCPGWPRPITILYSRIAPIQAGRCNCPRRRSGGNLHPALRHGGPGRGAHSLQKEQAETDVQIARLEKLLASDFANKAPAAVVLKERERLAAYRETARS